MRIILKVNVFHALIILQYYLNFLKLVVSKNF